VEEEEEEEEEEEVEEAGEEVSLGCGLTGRRLMQCTFLRVTVATLSNSITISKFTSALPCTHTHTHTHTHTQRKKNEEGKKLGGKNNKKRK
jgi:hypothetical protein